MSVCHGSGDHPWMTACGLDRANVVRWTDRATDVTCRACMTAPEARESSFIDGTDLIDSLLDEPSEDVAVAEVLAAHEADVTSYDAGDLWGCRCGWELTASQRSHDYDGDKWADYRAHLAEALAPLIAERERAAAVEAWDEGWVTGNRWAFSDADADAIETNPHRADRRAER